MNSRVLAFRLAAAALFGSLGFGAAPAQAQNMICSYDHHGRAHDCHGTGLIVSPRPHHSGCGACGTSYVVPQARYYASACGGCGTRYIVPQPQYYYRSSCGGCGGRAYYGGHHVQPIVQREYYGVPAVETEVVEPEFEQSPVYYEGRRTYRRAAFESRIDRRIRRRIDRRLDRRFERRVEHRVERRIDRRRHH